MTKIFVISLSHAFKISINNSNQNNDKIIPFDKEAGLQAELGRVQAALFLPMDMPGPCMLLLPERLVREEGSASCSVYKHRWGGPLATPLPFPVFFFFFILFIGKQKASKFTLIS